jgi:hypothetical protein
MTSRFSSRYRMQNRIKRMAGLLALALLGAGVTPAWHDGTAWHHETIDRSLSVGGHASLDLDRNGYPHLAYYAETYDRPNRDLKHAIYVEAEHTIYPER